MHNLITTNELIALLFSFPKHYVEARLLLRGCCATHFLYYSRKWLYNEGIDGETVRQRLSEFRQQYQNATWHLDQLIELV